MYITNGRVLGGGGGGGPEHFYILVISWQFEHFWEDNLSISEQTNDKALTIHTEL